MRGKGGSIKAVFAVVRITPAYAGKREFKNAAAGMDEDHPRLCGEKHISFHSLPFNLGSPPPMRGKGSGSSRHGSDIGITPAYAGKSEFCPKSSQTGQDHPRLCGEKPA